jgi:hypothetical protein
LTQNVIHNLKVADVFAQELTSKPPPSTNSITVTGKRSSASWATTPILRATARARIVAIDVIKELPELNERSRSKTAAASISGAVWADNRDHFARLNAQRHLQPRGDRRSE